MFIPTLHSGSLFECRCVLFGHFGYLMPVYGNAVIDLVYIDGKDGICRLGMLQSHIHSGLITGR